MTKKEMSEIFAVLLLAYPNAETFKGGIQKLGPTISLWATCLQDVDFWTGQQAVVKLCRECKFPPTIAEFREKAEAVTSEVKERIDVAWNHLKFSLDEKPPEEVYAALPEGVTKAVIAAMGGPAKFIVHSEHHYGSGRVEPYDYYDYSGFCTAYKQLLRQASALDGTRAKAIGPGQIGGKMK